MATEAPEHVYVRVKDKIYIAEQLHKCAFVGLCVSDKSILSLLSAWTVVAKTQHTDNWEDQSFGGCDTPINICRGDLEALNWSLGGRLQTFLTVARWMPLLSSLGPICILSTNCATSSCSVWIRVRDFEGEWGYTALCSSLLFVCVSRYIVRNSAV